MIALGAVVLNEFADHDAQVSLGRLRRGLRHTGRFAAGGELRFRGARHRHVRIQPAGGAWAFSPLSGSNGSGITSNGSPFTLQSSSAPEGVQAAFIQGTGTISQAISGFKPGLTYTLIFSAAERGPGATWNIAGQTWNVTRDGVSMASYAPPKSATSYTDYTATFTATATTHTLGFVGTNANGGDNTVFFDNIRIVVGLPPP